MPYKAIMGLIPTIQAASLAGHNVGKIKQKKTNTKDILDLGVTNIVGVSLIQAESQIIGGL